MRAAEMYFRNASVEQRKRRQKKIEIRCQYLYFSTSKARKLSTLRKARVERGRCMRREGRTKVCVCVYLEEGEGGTEEGACDERVE
jgi:hypothetical protein